MIFPASHGGKPIELAAPLSEVRQWKRVPVEIWRALSPTEQLTIRVLTKILSGRARARTRGAALAVVLGDRLSVRN